MGIAGDAGGMSVMDKSGQSIVGLGGSASDSSLVLRNPTTTSDMVTLTAGSGSLGRGLIISSSSTAQAGTVITDDGGMTWVGDWSPEAKGRGPGCFVVKSKEHGVAMSIRDKKDSPGVLLFGGAESAQIQIKSHESGDVALGEKDGVGAVFVIRDASGTEIVRLPPR